MAENTLRVIARIKARPNKVNELLSILKSLVEPTRKESGCIQYDLLQNNEDPTDFTLIEEWQNDTALQSHFATEHFKGALFKLPNLVASEPEIQRYHLVC
ncbi:MAG: antibiotic biosynthesis monooxygenase [Syntrophaceae bacterium]|nr:antibiotic biosynthesis monooxygenase [Syntrophaceae bacterium]